MVKEEEKPWKFYECNMSEVIFRNVVYAKEIYMYIYNENFMNLPMHTSNHNYLHVPFWQIHPRNVVSYQAHFYAFFFHFSNTR